MIKFSHHSIPDISYFRRHQKLPYTPQYLKKPTGPCLHCSYYSHPEDTIYNGHCTRHGYSYVSLHFSCPSWSNNSTPSEQ